MAFDDIFSPEQGQAVNSVAHSAFLSLLASPGDAPFAAMPRILEGVRANEKLGMTRGARKALLVQAGYPEAQAEQFSADDTTTKLALQQKDNDGLSNLAAGYFGGGAVPVSNLGMGAPKMSPSAPPGPAAGASLTGSQTDKAKVWYEEAIKQGATPLEAAAMVGNFTAENGLNTSGKPGDSGTAFGGGQWRHERLDNLKRTAAERGEAWDSVPAQVAHTLNELKGGDAGAARARALIAQAKTPEEAAAIFARHFERPSNQSLAASLPTRTGAAAQAYSLFGQGGRTQVADASGTVPAQPPGLPVVDSRQPGFDPSSGTDPLAGFVSSTGQTNAILGAAPSPGPGRSSLPLGRAPTRGPVQVAETEADTQAMEGRMGMLPPSVYGITPEARGAGGASPADLPAPNAQEAGFEIPPGEGAQAPRYAPDSRTAQALAARQTASTADDADKVKRGLAVIAQSGRYGERAKPMVEAIKLQLQPLLKNMEETEAQKLVKAAGLPEDQARSVLAGAIAGNASTSLQKEYGTYRQQEQAAGRTPLSQFDYDVALSKAKAATNKVEIGGEKSYDSDQGKAYSDVMKEAQTAGRRAPSVIATLNQAEQLMSTPGFKSGLGSTFALPAKQVLAALGGDPKAPASMEAFRSLSNKAVTDALGGSLGAGVSNSDVSFLQKQVASLDNSVEGNRAIISSARRVAEHQQKVADFTSDYADRNGGRLDRNYDRELRAWAKQNPIFTPEERGEKPAAKAKPATPMNTTDRAVSIRNAKAFIAANPGKRDAVIERLKAAGINTENF